MAKDNLMSAIAGLSDAKPDPDKVKASAKKPKVVNLNPGKAKPEGKKY